MKVIVIKSNVKTAIAAVERCASEHPTLPILKNVLVTAQKNGIQLSATNLEIAQRAFVSGKVVEPGSVTVPLDAFSRLITALPSERLNLEAKGQNLYIQTDNYEGTLLGLPSDDFPIIPNVANDKPRLDIEGDLLAETLTQVLAATQALDLRPELSCLLLDFSMDTLKCVATDSFRLAERTLNASQYKSTFEGRFTLTLPLKSAQEILRLCKGIKSVSLYHDQNQIFVKTDQFEFVSRLLDAQFPDYSAVIPKSFTSEVILDRQEFMNAIKLASVLGAKTNEVKVNILKEKKAVEVHSVDTAVGENRYVLPGKVTGVEESLSFNWRYLLEGLRVLRGDEVFFGIYQENKKAFIKDTRDSSYFYVLASLYQA